MRQFAYITAVSISFFFVLGGTSMSLAQTISPETVPHPKGPYLTLEIAPVGNQIWNSATWRRRVQMTVKKVLLGTASLDDNKAIFDAWYKNYELRRFIETGNTDPAKLSAPGSTLESPSTLRQLFLKKHLNAAKPRVVYDLLTKQTLEFMKKVIGARSAKECHPAARYNAMLLVGELNARKENPSTKSPAVPLPDAMEYMLGELTNPKQIDPVRIAAMSGIERHALLTRFLPEEEGIRSADRLKIQKLLTDLLKRDTPPTGRTLEGHQWMQRIAARTLGNLGSPGPSNVVADTLAAVLANPKSPIKVRLAAAAALGNMKTMQSKNHAAIIQGFAKIAYDIANSELNTIDKYREEVALRRKLATKEKVSGIEADIEITNQLVVRAACARVRYQYNLLQESLIEGETKLPAPAGVRTPRPAGLKNALALAAANEKIDGLADALGKVVTTLDPTILDVDSLYNSLVGAETTFKKDAGVIAPTPEPEPPIDLEGPGLELPGTVPKKPADPGDPLLPF